MPRGADGRGDLAKNYDIVVNPRPAAVESVSSPNATGVYGLGETILVNVTFSKPVVVNTASDLPALGLVTGPTTGRSAEYVSGNDTASLLFEYTVKPGDSSGDLGYADDASLSLNGATIAGYTGGAASLALPAPGLQGSLSNGTDIAVDHAAPVLIPGEVATVAGGFGRLGSVQSTAATIEIDGARYVLAGTSGVQLIRVHENGTIVSASSAQNSDPGYDTLNTVYGIDAFWMNGAPYAIATAWIDDGVQLMRVHGNNDSLSPVRSLRDNSTMRLDGAFDVKAFEMGANNDTYALVGSSTERGVQLIRVHGDGRMTGVDSLWDSGQSGGTVAALHYPIRLDTFRLDNGSVRALAASYSSHAIHLFGVDEATGLTHLSTTRNGTGGFDLGLPHAVDAFKLDGKWHALVGVEGGDAIVLFRVNNDDGTLEPVSAAVDGEDGFGLLAQVKAISVIGGGGGASHAYALVTSASDNAIQLIRVGADGTLLPAGTARDDSAVAGSPFTGLGGPHRGAATFSLAGRTYAAVSSSTDGAVQFARLSLASVASVNSTADDRVHVAGERINVTVNFGGPVAFSGDPPSLLLDVGVTPRSAAYLAGNATSSFVFNYTARADDVAPDLGYAGVDALSGDLRDMLDGLPANPTLPAPGSPASLSGSSAIVLDSGAPRPVAVSSTSGAGPHGIGTTINIAVRFDEAVTVSTVGGTPEIAIAIGDQERVAEYASGSPGQDIVFGYDVAQGDLPGDLVQRGQGISLNGGSIRAADDNGAVILALPAPAPLLGGGGSPAVDGVAPRIASVTSPDANSTYGTGTVVNITVAFTEPVQFVPDGTRPTILLDTGSTGGQDRHARCMSSALNAQQACTYTVSNGDATADLGTAAGTSLEFGGGAAQDRAGNELASAALPTSPENTLRGSKDIALDTSVPEVLRVTSPNSTGPHDAGSKIHIDVVFNGTVTIDPDPTDGDAVPRLHLETGEFDRTAQYAGGSSTDTLAFVYTVNAGDYTPDLNYTAAGALDLGHRALVDEYSNRARSTALPDPSSADSLGGQEDIEVRTVPTVASVGANYTGASLKVGKTVGVDVTFSEKVTVDPASGDGVPHIELETGRDVRGLAVYSSGSGTHILSFAYPVNHTDNVATLDYAGVEALKSNSAQIRGVGMLDANLALPDPDMGGSLASANIRLLPNEAPLIVPPGNRSVSADRPDLQLNVFVTATDPETEAVTFSLVEPVPSGAAIDAVTGRFTWAPTDAQRTAQGNPYNITVRAADPHNASDTAWFIVTVIEAPPLGHTGPVIGAVEDVSAREGEAIRFDMNATGGRTPHTFSLVTDADPPPPAGAIIYNNGTFSWTPNYEQNGTYTITAIVADYFNYNGTQTFTVAVADAEPPDNTPPRIEPVDLQSADEGSRLVVNVTADDVHVPITYSLAGVPPDGAAIHPATGVFTWNIGYDEAGNHTITVSAADRYNSTSNMSFTVIVADRAEPNLPPEIAPIPALSATVGEALALQVNATDPNEGDELTFVLVDPHPEGAAMDTGGLFTWTPERGDVGTNTLNVTVRDDRGLSDWANLTITVADLDANNASATAVFAGPRTVRIDYNASLGAPAGHEGGLYGSVSIAGGGSAEPSSVSGLGTRTHIVRLDGDAAGASQNGTIRLLASPEGLVDGTLYRFADDAIPVGAGETARTFSPPGAAPVVAIESDGFVRTLNATAAGDSARPAINLARLAGAGGASATLPAERVAVIASFAEVSFPPGTVAMSVPADGLLELYVAERAPTAQEIADGLGVGAADILEVRRVVEVGDNATRIVFDLPVRILLVGQANGTAFYAGGANGTVVPITRVCDADNTDAVHAQLEGSGECQRDSDDGEDKIIYTYHLTRFGTAEVDPGETCAASLSPREMSLGRAGPGDRSDVSAAQNVVSEGTLSLASVSVNATAWTGEGGAVVMMPASATSVMVAGAWTPLGGAEPVPLPLDGGSASAKFRVDVPRDALQAGVTSPVDASQALTYTVTCDAPTE